MNVSHFLAAALAQATPPLEGSSLWVIRTLAGVIVALGAALAFSIRALSKRGNGHKAPSNTFQASKESLYASEGNASRLMDMSLQVAKVHETLVIVEKQTAGLGCKAPSREEVERLAANAAIIRDHQAREDSWNEDVRGPLIAQFHDVRKAIERIESQAETREERNRKLAASDKLAGALAELAKTLGERS